MKIREILTWKFLLYEGFLPLLRHLGPGRADAVLSAIGRASVLFWPPRRARLASAMKLVYLNTGIKKEPTALGVGVVRFLARDYLLDTDNDEALGRFDASGAAAFDEALGQGRGVVLVGSHLGAHLAALHWLYRRGVPLRLMVQRPKHVTRALSRFFDRDEPEPQADFFLRRTLNPSECVARIMRARAALRAGKVVYLPGDIPWAGANSRAGHFLGRNHQMLSVWADLAALTGAPVFHLFCTHKPGGRFALTLESAGRVTPGEEAEAVDYYLSRLEARIAAHPGDAVAHLLWPCYGAPQALATDQAKSRPSRRVAAFSCGKSRASKIPASLSRNDPRLRESLIST